MLNIKKKMISGINENISLLDKNSMYFVINDFH